jgi:hypothetical protein
MTTDNGIDLVAYSPTDVRPRTIQIKTNLRAKPGGGKGRLALDWWIEDDSPAEVVALVDLSFENIWLFRMAQLAEFAQQKPAGRLHLYMYGEEDYTPRRPNCHERDFERFLIENSIGELFAPVMQDGPLQQLNITEGDIH